MTHEALPPFAGWIGPKAPRILLVGEAWGENEAQLRQPFVGASGKELWLMLGEALVTVAPELHAAATAMHKYDLAWVKHRQPWLEAAGIAMTNVLSLRPPDNKVEALCAARRDLDPGDPALVWPAVARGQYLRSEYLPELGRLFEEIEISAPNLIVALGATACWALLRTGAIGSIRGTVAEAVDLVVGASARTDDYGKVTEVLDRPVKVLPTYHPATVLRQWNWRPIVVADLMKASREAGFAEIRRPRRLVMINPTLDEVGTFVSQTLANRPRYLACDIETGAGQIKCISFARARDEAIVIPFVDQGQPDYSYWRTVEEEVTAWKWVKLLLESTVPKVGQNFIYDLQYLTREGIRPRACYEDTMLLHHSHFPEMQKGLGFLGSVYTDESSWKLMRRARPDTEKRDE